MKIPTLMEIPTYRDMVDAFQGYNHNMRIGAGEFYDMQNMTSTHYPILAPRDKRGVFLTPDESVTGLITKDALCWVEGSDFVMNGDHYDLELTDGEKTLISMGAYVIIMPDKKYFNTADITDYGAIETQYPLDTEPAVDITFTLCTFDADEYAEEDYERGDSAPSDFNKLWLDTSSTPHSLKKYATATDMWVTIPTTYVKIKAPGIGTNFAQYDGVSVSGIVAKGCESLNGSLVVQKRDTDYLVVIGILDEETTQTASQGKITFKRFMPEMDFIVESNNRLWGCRYGTDVNGNVVNEIYASKLGDFKNWHCYMGISTDSYAASVGTDGQFTGAVTHLGYPLFFKENCLHKVYGNYPANYQIQATACRGVQKGSSRSLAIVNEVLYYKGRLGVCAYDGSLPTEISTALGDTAYFNAVAGSHGNKYYISMADASGAYHLFVYDTQKGMWHKEDNTRADAFCSCDNEMYFIDHADGKVKTIFGSGATQETDPVEWMVESGIIGVDSPDKKYISKLNVRMSMDIGTEVEFFTEYDSMGIWESVCTLHGTSLRSFTIPIHPKRCDHMRLRIVGKGKARIFSICKTIEQGSDV